MFLSSTYKEEVTQTDIRNYDYALIKCCGNPYELIGRFITGDDIIKDILRDMEPQKIYSIMQNNYMIKSTPVELINNHLNNYKDSNFQFEKDFYNGMIYVINKLELYEALGLPEEEIESV